MLQVRCPSCGKSLNVSEQYAGKKVRCPGCQGVLTVSGPEAPVDVVPTPPSARRPPPPIPAESHEVRPAPPAARQPRPADDDYDDGPRRGSRGRDDDYDDRPRRRSLRRGEWADCPHCGASNATRVHWTFWGGMIGPAIINVVRCNDCGTNYNGIHGDSNGGRIAAYVVISLVLGLIVAGVLIAVAASNS